LNGPVGIILGSGTGIAKDGCMLTRKELQARASGRSNLPQSAAPHRRNRLSDLAKVMLPQSGNSRRCK